MWAVNSRGLHPPVSPAMLTRYSMPEHLVQIAPHATILLIGIVQYSIGHIQNLPAAKAGTVLITAEPPAVNAILLQ
jgi:hypothetical protein